MIFPPVHELAAIGTFDVGQPNHERILLRPTQPVDLSQFAIVLAKKTTQMHDVVRDHLFWFPQLVVTPPAWVVVFSGNGDGRWLPAKPGEDPVLALYWGKQYALFDLLAPILVRVDAALFPTIAGTTKQSSLLIEAKSKSG